MKERANCVQPLALLGALLAFGCGASGQAWVDEPLYPVSASNDEQRAHNLPPAEEEPAAPPAKETVTLGASVADHRHPGHVVDPGSSDQHHFSGASTAGYGPGATAGSHSTVTNAGASGTHGNYQGYDKGGFTLNK